jgi:ligand-binding sensor domain-containing protein
MIRKILILWLLAINVIVIRAYAQDYSELRQYTIADGLPSNYIYDLVEDNNGFLWIATDNGVSRFDGKYFKNFSIKDGLPSFDAVNIRKDGQGKIWVNCYQQNPVYFDESNNKFIKIKEYATDSLMKKGVLLMYNTENGGIEFNNLGGRWQFKNQKLIKYSNVGTFEDGKIKVILVYYKSKINKLNYDVFLNAKNKIILQKLKNQLTNTVYTLSGQTVDDDIYFFDGTILNKFLLSNG